MHTLAKSKSVSKQNSFHNFKTLKQMSSLIQKKSVSRQYKHNETLGDWKNVFILHVTEIILILGIN